MVDIGEASNWLLEECGKRDLMDEEQGATEQGTLGKGVVGGSLAQAKAQTQEKECGVRGMVVKAAGGRSIRVLILER